MQLQINEESLPVYEALASKQGSRSSSYFPKDECQRFGKRTWSEQCYHDDAREKLEEANIIKQKSRTTKFRAFVSIKSISVFQKIFNALIRKKHRYLLVTIQIMQLNQHAV